MSTIQQAQPPLKFIPPDLNFTVVRLMQVLLPALLRSRTSIRRIEAENVDVLVDLYRQFQAGNIRFLMAFRHPSADDPYCLAYLLSRLVPQAAKAKGVALQRPVHSHFLYDRGIPLWAGSFTSWLYPKLGGTPIMRGKLDRQGLRSARDLFANGPLPMAAAPEGATNGHSEIVSPIEPGVSQLGFWCVEDLQKAGRSEEVWIVPIGIQYHFIAPPWANLNTLLTDLEIDAGLLPAGSKPPTDYSEDKLYERLYRLGQRLLSAMEQHYIRFYHQDLPEAQAIATDPASTPLISNEAFFSRLNALLNAALTVAEDYFALPPNGTVIDRCRRLEQAAWDYIYREDLKDADALSPLERGLADRIAEEADLRAWHMRLVESFVAVTGRYVKERPTAERFAETTLLMRDVLTRIKGNQNPFNRPSLGNQRVLLTVGQPISVSARWDAYKENRRNAKQAVNQLTQDLQTALESLIR